MRANEEADKMTTTIDISEMTREQKIDYVLKRQAEGISRSEIRKEMGYKKTGTLTELMTRGGYKYNKELDKFISEDMEGTRVGHSTKHVDTTKTKVVSDTCRTPGEDTKVDNSVDNNVAPTPKEDIIEGDIVPDTGGTLVLQDATLQNRILDIFNTDKYDRLVQLLGGETPGGHVSDTTTIIELTQGLELTYLKSVEKDKNDKTSIRVNTEIMNRFRELSNSEEYKRVNGSNLISQALHEFIEKYKK